MVNALETYNTDRGNREALTAARRARLSVAEQGMGLAMPGRGVSAPVHLPDALTAQQQHALDALGQPTFSPGNGMCFISCAIYFHCHYFYSVIISTFDVYVYHFSSRSRW